MGPHMLCCLGSGGLGIDGFYGRYRDSFHTWWPSLGTPTLDADTARLLAAAIAEEERGLHDLPVPAQGDHAGTFLDQACTRSEREARFSGERSPSAKPFGKAASELNVATRNAVEAAYFADHSDEIRV